MGDISRDRQIARRAGAIIEDFHDRYAGHPRRQETTAATTGRKLLDVERIHRQLDGERAGIELCRLVGFTSFAREHPASADAALSSVDVTETPLPGVALAVAAAGLPVSELHPGRHSLSAEDRHAQAEAGAALVAFAFGRRPV